MWINLRDEREGEEKVNNQGSKMKIISYIRADDIYVQFEDKYNAIVHTSYDSFQKGKVRNPYYPSVYDRGYIGTKYPAYEEDQTNVATKEFTTWGAIMSRAYGFRRPQGYDGVVVAECWWNYENFYEWVHSQSNYQYWKNGGRDWAIDKDIIKKNNKMYCSEYCCLVPREINSLLTGQKVPMNHYRGVRRDYHNNLHPYSAYVYGGTFSTPWEAFLYYKQNKEAHIKEVAKKYYKKRQITEECYQGLINYEIDP